MNKKGSMELSVNSIVILIIAVVMMGLILGFLKTQFNKININQEVSDPPIPTPSESITLSPSAVSVTQGGKIYLKVGVFNNGINGGQDSMDLVTVAYECARDSNGNPLLTLEGSSLSQTIPYGEYRIFGATVKATGSDTDTYPCRVCVSRDGINCFEDPTYVKEISVEVK